MDRRLFSDLVAAIYDGAVDVSLWPRALGLICDSLGFRKGTMDLNRLPDMTNLFNFHHGIDGPQAATMISHYGGMPEVWGGIDAIITRPIDRPWVVSSIMPRKALIETTYYRNWVGPMGLVDGAAIVLARDDELFGSLRLATDASTGLITEELVDALDMLLPHCQRAARISGLLNAAQATSRNFQMVIDAMTTPIVLVSADCAVVHTNGRAQELLDEGTILSVHQGRLCSPKSSLRNNVARLIRNLAEDETQSPGGAAGLSVEVSSGSRMTLHLLPLVGGSVRTRLAEDAVAAIFISSIPRGGDAAPEGLRAAFNLTGAEMAVLGRILAGRRSREIAADLGIAYSTVRTHVLHLLQKTAVRTRADLVRLAHAYTKPIADANARVPAR